MAPLLASVVGWLCTLAQPAATETPDAPAARSSVAPPDDPAAPATASPAHDLELSSAPALAPAPATTHAPVPAAAPATTSAPIPAAAPATASAPLPASAQDPRVALAPAPTRLAPPQRASSALTPRPAPSVVVAPRPTRPRAEPRARLPRGWAIDLTAGTAVPLIVGAAVQVETPPRILGQFELGGLVSRYVDALDGYATRARRDPAGGGLVRDASRDALVVRVALGARPLKKRGLEVRGGYTVVTHGRGTTSLAALGGLDDVGFADANQLIPISATVHSIHADIGWRWVIREHILVRAAVGYLQSLGADMYSAETWTDDEQLIHSTAEALSRLAAAGANSALRGPLLAIHAGYRF